MNDKYKSEASINKVLAELQIAGAAVADNIEEEQEKTFENLIREALQSENEAIKIYLTLEAKSKKLGSKILEKAFAELKKDETEHVGNLQYLLKLLCPDAIEGEQEGEVEEATLQADNKPEG